MSSVLRKNGTLDGRFGMSGGTMNRVAQQILRRIRRPRVLAGETLPADIVLPAYDGYSLANLPATVLRHFGVEGPQAVPLAGDVTGDHLEGARKLVVLLVDALGYLALAEQMASDRQLSLNALARRGRFVPLTTVFPSTTAVALSSLHTGLPPVGHAITGYRMYLPGQGGVANMIRLSPETDERANRLLQRPGDARALLGVPTVHRRLTRAGIRSYCLIQDTICQSGLSKMLYDGATETVPFVSSSEMFVRVRKMLETDPNAPACIWAYWGALDTLSHICGPGGEEAAAEVRNLAYSLHRELVEPYRSSGKRRAALILTSDHGQIQVDRNAVVSLCRFRKLRGMLAGPPTGTSRSAYLHLKAGCLPDGYVQRILSNRAIVLPRREALAAGLWGPGPVRDEVPERVGDVLLVMRENRALFYPYHKGSVPSGLEGGRHGGLHEQEMLIPFFCIRL